MKYSGKFTFTIGLLTALLLSVIWPVAIAQQQTDADLLVDAKERFEAIQAPTSEAVSQPLVTLGRKLYWDERLSANGKIACASCHSASTWGADAAQFSLDAKGKLTKRNSQTVLNALMQPHLRWTADRKSGAHQAEKSLTGSMGFAQADEIVRLLVDYGYETLFKAAFPEDDLPTSPANYAKAIEAYEATLTTPASFDLFLTGDLEALNPAQKQGLRTFIELGCADCHSGKLLGGKDLERFGIHHEYWTLTKSQVHDEGLYEVTKKQEDKFYFRVSMLRNIEKTAPYFHDGSVATLHDAIRIMGKVQLDKELSDDQVESLVEFLVSLTGEVPAHYVKD